MRGLHSVWCVGGAEWHSAYRETIVFGRNVSMSSSWPTAIRVPPPHPPPFRLRHLFRVAPLLCILRREDFRCWTGFAL